VALTLAAALALAPLLPGQLVTAEIPAPPEAPEAPEALEAPEAPEAKEAQRIRPHWEHVSDALIRLDQALVQQFSGELWSEVRETVAAGQLAALAARDGGADLGLCLAMQRTLSVLSRRQDLLEREAFAGDRARSRHPDDEQAATAWIDAEYAAAAAGFNGLADELSFAEGRLPQTSYLLVELLFGQQRDDEAGQALARGLALWPDDTGLHEQAQAWSGVLLSPEHLLNQLERRVDVFDITDADFAGIALETISVLQTAMGKARYADQEYALAGLHFDRASRALQRVRSMPRQWGQDELDYREADALVNAAYSYMGLALAQWKPDRADETGALAAEACEKALTDALRTIPGHADASEAVLWLGESLMKKGDDTAVTHGDVAQMRDLYGRMAKRFDNAVWWNNFAFWCRETGSAAEGRGELDEAHKLYEASYDAYQHTIALAPDNARYVNDTGLMLLYHLHRDLDVAQELFERAWKLGADVCENPFVEDDVHDFNFEAYCDAMLNLSRLHLEREDLAAADEVMALLLELAPQRPDVRMTEAEIRNARAPAATNEPG